MSKTEVKPYQFKLEAVDVTDAAAAVSPVIKVQKAAYNIFIDYTKGDEDGLVLSFVSVENGTEHPFPAGGDWSTAGDAKSITLAASGQTTLELDTSGVDNFKVKQVRNGAVAATGSFDIIVKEVW